MVEEGTKERFGVERGGDSVVVCEGEIGVGGRGAAVLEKGAEDLGGEGGG